MVLNLYLTIWETFYFLSSGTAGRAPHLRALGTSRVEDGDWAEGAVCWLMGIDWAHKRACDAFSLFTHSYFAVFDSLGFQVMM